jgi:negative elongation factor C/D
MLLNSLYCDKNEQSFIEEGCFIAKRLSQQIELAAAKDKGYNITQFTLSFNNSNEYPKLYSGLHSILTKNSLNTSDITNIYKLYTSEDPPPPPVDLIRNGRFLNLLVNYFFDPTTKPNAEYRSKYQHLLAYAVSVTETYEIADEEDDDDDDDDDNEEPKLIRKTNKEHLEDTEILIENAWTICHENKASNELLNDLNELFKCMIIPTVSIGIIKWIEAILLDPSYFKLNSDGSPMHLIIIDEIVQLQPLLHDRCLNLYIKLFKTNFNDLDNLAHFVIEVLEMISPPYSNEFIHLFVPLLENEYINSFSKADEAKMVKDFLTSYDNFKN